MKLKYKLTLLLIGLFLTGFSQYYTPNCTPIYSTYQPPLTQWQIDDANYTQQMIRPNVVKLEEPTSSYNCHNYAWVKRDGGAPFWLTTPGDDTFWDDGSYTEVTTNTNELELRVSYTGDHSAVITGSSYECTSKWGAWGLYIHDINYVPAGYLPGSTKKYYKKSFVPVISGSSPICSTQMYSISNLPVGATVTWSITGPFIINGSATANPVDIWSAGSHGSGVLTATITYLCGTYTATKEIASQLPPKPDYVEIMDPHGGEMNLCPNQTYYMEVGGYNTSLYSQVNWYLPPGWSSPTAGGGSNTFSTTGLLAFMIQITTGSTPTTDILTATFTNSCGQGEARLVWVSTQTCGGYLKTSVYPNPANSEISIQVEGETPFDVVKILNQKGEVLVSYNNKQKLSKVSLDTRNIPNGRYFVHIYRGKTISKKQIIVSH
ncbi:MAG: T9SS type A sorting domain-containing protein [Bacteroidota bacterium]